MPKVSIAPLADTTVASPSTVFAGDGEVRTFFDGDKHPIHVHLHTLSGDQALRIAPTAVDCVAYVWRGGVSAAGKTLVSGSSLVVEHGASLDIVSTEETSQLVTFTAAVPAASPRAGGHVHLMPTEQVPRFGDIAAGSALSGGLHADAACPTCCVWLHENSFAAPDPNAPAVDPEAGIHSHTEDEVIFVTSGQMRLGPRLYGPGTALAIAATTMYSFLTGPAGLSFINFRPGQPRDIRLKDGRTMDEVGYWRERVPAPRPISL